jgi:hypothetical protein
MPGRRRPTPEDAATARRALLDGFTRDIDIFEVLIGLAPFHPRNDTFPGEVFLQPQTRWSGARPAWLSRRPWRVPARVRLPRQAERQAAVRSPGCGGRPRRDRAGPAGRVRLVAGRRLLAVRHVRGGRLHPRRRQPGRRPGPPSMPGPQRAPRPPGSKQVADSVQLFGRLSSRGGCAQILALCVVVVMRAPETQRTTPGNHRRLAGPAPASRSLSQVKETAGTRSGWE